MVDIVHLILDGVHLLAIMVWIGGAIFLDRILQPSMSSIPPDQAGKLMAGILKRFTPLAGSSFAIIGITGIIRSYLKGSVNIAFLLESSSGNLLLLKAALVCVMLVFGLVLARTGKKLEKRPSPEDARKIQKRIKLLSETNIGVGIIVVLLAVARL